MTICPPEECTGCAACLNICGVGAISFVPDDEGFLRPSVDTTKCVRCGRCARICPQNHPLPLPQGPKQVFACWHKDETIRKASSSGGAFSALAETIIARGGVVYGAAFDDFPIVRHIRITEVSQLALLRGSKYVQSEIGRVLLSVRNDLDEGIPVLFSGTPCQIEGLYSLLGSRADRNLVTVDLVCHGVNSPMVFSDHIKDLEGSNHSRIRHYEFRNKETGWRHFQVVASLENEHAIVQWAYENPFFKGFLKHLYLRPSCARCQYANPRHPGDITICDFWGYKPVSMIDHDEDKGVSAVIVNTDRGKRLFKDASIKLNTFHRSLEEVVRGNDGLQGASAPSPVRHRFWQLYLRSGYCRNLVKTFLDPEFKKRRPLPLRRRVKHILKSAFGDRICHLAKISAARTLHLPKQAAKSSLRFVRQRILDRILLYFQVKRQPHVFVFASPGHTNLGDCAQTLCTRELLEVRYPDRRIVFFTDRYVMETNYTIISFIKKIARSTDPVFLHSGYHMTDVWPSVEKIHRIVTATFRDRPIIAFPQTIHYQSTEARNRAIRVFNAHPNNTIMCRDIVSFETAKSLFPDCKLLLVPDVVTSKIGQYKFTGDRSGILVCKRTDKESACDSTSFSRIVSELSKLDVVTVSDTNANDSWKTIHKDLSAYLERIWREYAKYRLVVTDRYHGTIFALISSTPVLVFSSTDHKVRSGLDWFPPSFSDYVRFIPKLDDIPAAASEMLTQPRNYSLPPYFKEIYFDHLFELLPQTEK